MGLFDFFRRKPPKVTSTDSSVPLERSSYDIAYFILPQYVFQSLDRLIELCVKSPDAAGAFYYVMACQARGIEPNLEAAKRYRWSTGEFDRRRYLALEYPTPTPVDMGDSDPISIMKSGAQLVLAPYFSVILYGNQLPPNYFILGQAPLDGGTTVRTVTAEGSNCNLGPGPEPKLDLFFEAIRTRLKNST